MSARPDVYVSADVEADGPLPGRYSMLSFGLAVAGTFDGRRFSRADPTTATFYRELRPVTDCYDDDHVAASHLDRIRLAETGEDVAQAMTAAAAWVFRQAEDQRPVLVAWPLAFDWPFLYWYFETFAPGGSPFGHSSCLDIRTQYQALAGTVFDRSGKATMPPFLQPATAHTHNALDDAVEQGELFASLLEWAIRQRNATAHGNGDESTPSWLAPHSAVIA